MFNSFKVRIGDSLTVAELHAKEEAKAMYRAAVSQGHSAQLLEQETGDIFSMRVGNLQPGVACIVSIRYILPCVMFVCL